MRNVAVPPEPYTCVVMYPDYACCDWPEFGRFHVTANDVFEAQAKAQKKARRACGADEWEDCAVVAVYAGHLQDIGA